MSKIHTSENSPDNQRGAAYAGRQPELTVEQIQSELEKADRAFSRLEQSMREFNQLGWPQPYNMSNWVEQLAYRRLRLLTQLRQQLLPPTERKPYSTELTQLMSVLARLTDQLGRAQAENLPELMELIGGHTQRLAAKIQALAADREPLGTPEIPQNQKLKENRIQRQLQGQWHEQRQK